MKEDAHFAAMVSTWNKEETLKLIETWGDAVMQTQLEGCKYNQEVYDIIAKELIEEGYQQSGKQCRDKIKKLKREYRKVRDKRSATGEERLPGIRCRNFTTQLMLF